MESILLWTGQNDQLQVMRMDYEKEEEADTRKLVLLLRREGERRIRGESLGMEL